MSSTMTVNGLAARVLGQKLCKEVEQVDLYAQTISSANDEKILAKSIDDLAGEHLSAEVMQALSKVDLKASELGAHFEIQQLRINIRGRGILIMMLTFWLVSRIADVNPLLHFLQALLGMH